MSFKYSNIKYLRKITLILLLLLPIVLSLGIYISAKYTDFFHKRTQDKLSVKIQNSFGIGETLNVNDVLNVQLKCKKTLNREALLAEIVTQDWNEKQLEGNIEIVLSNTQKQIPLTKDTFFYETTNQQNIMAVKYLYELSFNPLLKTNLSNYQLQIEPSYEIKTKNDNNTFLKEYFSVDFWWKNNKKTLIVNKENLKNNSNEKIYCIVILKFNMVKLLADQTALNQIKTSKTSSSDVDFLENLQVFFDFKTVNV